MLSMTAMGGGCQCGRIRYVAEVESDDAYLCHCKMCRRATGNVSVSYVNLPIGRVDWAHEPDWYHSSPIARRAFCSVCGTPLAFAFLDRPITIDMLVGSFDAPERFEPKLNYAVGAMMPTWLDCRYLPQLRIEDNPNVVTRWMKTVGHIPD